MHGLIVSDLINSETGARPEIQPSPIDRFVIRISRISGYVFMAAALALIGFFFL